MPLGKCASLRCCWGATGVMVVLAGWDEGGVSPTSSESRGRLGRLCIALVPGAGNSQSSLRPLCLHLSHGGLSS
jgi:hypothetical protein